MKNRIYKIKDKILVQGNENKLTENEILVKEENGSVVLKERVNGEVKSIAGGGNLITKNVTIGGSPNGNGSDFAGGTFVKEITLTDFIEIKNSNKLNISLPVMNGVVLSMLKNYEDTESVTFSGSEYTTSHFSIYSCLVTQNNILLYYTAQQ